MMPKMLFLTLSNVDVNFQAQNLQQKSYIIGNVFLTTWQIKLIGKKAFAAAIRNPKHKVFVIYIAALSVNLGDEVQPAQNGQITYRKADKAFFKVLSKHADFTDVFFTKISYRAPRAQKNQWVCQQISK